MPGYPKKKVFISNILNTHFCMRDKVSPKNCILRYSPAWRRLLIDGEYKLEDILPNMDSTNDELNSPIIGEQIKRCIIKMNTNKYPGNNCIINEYITSTCELFKNRFSLFNEIICLRAVVCLGFASCPCLFTLH